MSESFPPSLTPLTVAIASLTMLFYGWFIYTISRSARSRVILRRLFRAITTVLNNNQNDDDCIRQIELNFRKASEGYPSETSNLRSCVNVLERMVFYYDTLGEKSFRSRFKEIDISIGIRNRVFAIIDRMKTQNPFASLDPKDANLLRSLQQAIGTSNVALGSSVLRQLADEIEVKESTIRTQESRSKVSFVIAVIGVVLTIIFGVVSYLR
jgi:hypothetical protein